MKNKLVQLYFFVNNIDQRYVQLAYFVFMLAGFVVTQSPSDGGGGTRPKL
jgi:hypothetical protein